MNDTTFILTDDNIAINKYQITKIFWTPKSTDKDLYGVVAEVTSGEKIIVNRDLSRKAAIARIQSIAAEF